MYDFNLYSADFMLEIILHLCEEFSELNLELISLIILNAGFKIRSDNPGILKVNTKLLHSLSIYLKIIITNILNI